MKICMLTIENLNLEVDNQNLEIEICKIVIYFYQITI